MQKILASISRLGDAYTGKRLNSEDFILYHRQLLLNNLPPIPTDYLRLLHAYNSLNYNGVNLFGINPREENDFDILSENILIEHPDNAHTLVLGMDELEYLVWNTTTKTYQTIDKDSFLVLNTYKNCATALLEFLKFDNEFEPIR